MILSGLIAFVPVAVMTADRLKSKSDDSMRHHRDGLGDDQLLDLLGTLEDVVDRPPGSGESVTWSCSPLSAARTADSGQL
jgi:hypothetical protein